MAKKDKLVKLPKGAWEAIIEAGPGSNHLLVWSDPFEEQGDTRGAECLRWIHAKNRWPHDARWVHSPSYALVAEIGRTYQEIEKDSQRLLPPVLVQYYNEANGTLNWESAQLGQKSPSHSNMRTMFERLQATWRILPEPVFRFVNDWTPPVVPKRPAPSPVNGVIFELPSTTYSDEEMALFDGEPELGGEE